MEDLVSGTVFLISLLLFSLLGKRNIVDFGRGLLYPSVLLNSLTGASSVLFGGLLGIFCIEDHVICRWKQPHFLSWHSSLFLPLSCLTARTSTSREMASGREWTCLSRSFQVNVCQHGVSRRPFLRLRRWLRVCIMKWSNILSKACFWTYQNDPGVCPFP